MKELFAQRRISVFRRGAPAGDAAAVLEPLPAGRAPIRMGNDVWIGRHVRLKKGIGNGAVIAAGRVVTKDVEPCAVVGAVPARLIRMRFDKATVERRERLRRGTTLRSLTASTRRAWSASPAAWRNGSPAARCAPVARNP